MHDTTTQPDCCYGNPDAGHAVYSKKWIYSCVAFYTERDGLLLTNGGLSCAWKALGDGYDCTPL